MNYTRQGDGWNSQTKVGGAVEESGRGTRRKLGAIPHIGGVRSTFPRDTGKFLQEKMSFLLVFCKSFPT